MSHYSNEFYELRCGTVSRYIDLPCLHEALPLYRCLDVDRVCWIHKLISPFRFEASMILSTRDHQISIRYPTNELKSKTMDIILLI